MALSHRSRVVIGTAIFGAAIVAGIILMARTSGLGYLAAGGIALGAIVVNGLLMTLEDDLPGGFNNPDGLNTPRYIRFVGYATHAALVLVCLSIAALLLFMSSQEPWPSLKAVALACFAIGAVFAYVAVKFKTRLGVVGLILLVAVPGFLLWVRYDG